MKTKKWILFLMFLGMGATTLADSPPWTGDGVYTFDDSDDFFGESWITDTATVTISGSEFGNLHCYDDSIVNMSGGQGNLIVTHENSILEISGGNLNFLTAYDSSEISITVLDYLVDMNSYLDYYQITGHWENSSEFDILVYDQSWPNISINVIPEPCTIAFLLTAIPFLKIRKQNR